MNKLFILVVICLIACTSGMAQGLLIKGNVVDENSEAMPGVNVIVKGTTQGTVTDYDGNYSIQVPNQKATLNFMFIGYKQQEVVVGTQTNISVTLEPDMIGIDEVVAVGYGYKKRSVVTGAISSLNSEELLQSKPANVSQALGGRAAGVVISQSSGQPGSTPKVVIRGVGTNGNSDPLFIIDGLPMSDMNSVNPSDIASMEVLKDATSTAIYGARGANGVVLITTKKGQKGKTTLTYDGYYGIQSAFNEPEMLNTDQYLELMKEFYANDGADYPATLPSKNEGVDTDWLDEITNNAPVTEHNISATMGGDRGSTLLSLGYRNQDGIIGEDKSFFERFNVRMNSTMEVTNFLKVGANINFTHINKNGVSTGTNGWNAVYYALQMDPATPVYDAENGDDRGFGVTTVPFTRMWNPLAFMDISSNSYNQTERFYGNTYLEATIIPGLIFKTDFGTNIKTNDARSFSPIYTHNASSYSSENSVSQSYSKSTSWQWENTLQYMKDFNDHSLAVLLGTTASEDNSVWMNGKRKNYPEEANTNDGFWYLDSGDVGTSTNGGSGSPKHSLWSQFGRVSYNYSEKYMAEFIIRRDGSSNFGPENQFGVFPGVSAGWAVSSEDFWNVPQFDYLKLRASWGQNGNESITPFSYTSIIVNDRNYTLGPNRSVITGSSPKSLVNPDVKWETSEQISIGADMGFFDNSLRFNVDYYNKTTKDLLFKPTLEKVRGNDAPYYNAGEVKNSGVELQLGYNFNISDLKVSLNANASYLKNEVIEVGNVNGYETGGTWQSDQVTRMEEGYPIGYFYGYAIDGIFQTQDEINQYKDSNGNLTYPNASPGDFKWNDKDKNGIIDADDRQNLGNPWPKWTYGGNIALEYKGFDFSLFFYGKAGVEVMMGQYRTEGYGRSNLPTFFLDRWQKAGDDTGIPRLTLDDPNGNFTKPSEFFIEDASFFKIGTIDLGYSLPKSVLEPLKLTKLRVYGAIDNAAIFSDYPMFDPEIGKMAWDKSILDTGIDYSMYPQARTFRFGVTLAF